MSTDKYALPDFATARVRYYNGQLLADDDFIFDQAYHIAHQRRHERLLHVAGITEGLGVTLPSGTATIEIAPGSAIDALGRQILLPQKQVLPAPTVDGTSYLEIAFSEVESAPSEQNSIVQANTRFSQVATPATLKANKTPGAVLLATLTRTAGVISVSFAERAYSGVRIPGPADTSGGGSLRSKGDGSPDWAELGCNLSVKGSATVNGTLIVTGAATLSQASVTNALGVSGLLTANSGVTVASGNVTLSPLGANQAVFTNGSKQLTTGTLSVSMGGTGATTLTGVLKGNGTGAVTAMTGTANKLARWTDPNTIAASAVITESGSFIGVGPLGPSAHLHVSGANVITRIESNGAGGWAELDLYSTFPTANLSKWNIAAQGTGVGGFAIRQFNDDRTIKAVPLFIDTNGNVGIGTGAATLRGRLDLGNGGLNANLRIGDYLDIGETALANFVYMGVNAILNTSNLSAPLANRFRPSYAAGSGMVFSQSGGGNGDLDFHGINWAGDASEKDFPTAFTHVMRLGVDGKVGIATGSLAPRTTLDTGTGVMSGAANDYAKAQVAMTGGGNISWVSDRLKWSARFICATAENGRTFSSGYVDIGMPGGSIPAAQVYDGVARTIDANGIPLSGWEALYAVHTVGGSYTAVQFRIQNFAQSFYAPSNWILVAVRNGDDGSVKVGTGAIIPAGRVLNHASPFRVTQVLNQAGGALPLSGTFTSSGNTLLIFASGSGFSNPATTIGMSISIDNSVKGSAKVTTNEATSHRAFTTNALVVTGISAGTHTLTLTALAGTTTDFNDFFTATVLEMPF